MVRASALFSPALPARPPAQTPLQALTSTLYLPPAALPANATVSLSLSVCYAGANDPETCGADTAAFRVLESPLVAALAPARLTVGRGALALLDASGSFDPDASAASAAAGDGGGLTFAWRCSPAVVNSSSGACLAPDGSQAAFSPGAVQQALRLQPGAYAVSVTVSQGARAATATAEVAVLAAETPTVQIVSLPPPSVRLLLGLSSNP